MREFRILSSAQIKIDTRDFNDFLKRFKKLTPYYLDEWTIDNNDFGTALANSFFYILDSVIKRLNKIPEKNFIEFLNLYGIKLVAAQSAIVPITFTISDRVKNDILVKKGTQLISTTDEGDEVLFTTYNDIMISRAKITKAFSFEKIKDKIFDLTKFLKSPKELRIFSDSQNGIQNHELLLGHSDLLNIKKYFNIIIKFSVEEDKAKTLHNILEQNTKWHIWYIDKKTKSEKTILLKKQVLTNKNIVQVKLIPDDNVENIEESKINDFLSRWIKCVFVNLEEQKNTSIPEIMINNLSLELQSSVLDRNPEKLYFNNLNFPDKINFFPFGKKPLTNSIFYVADSASFSKKGYEVTLRLFHREVDALLMSDFEGRIISWEYWNGRYWTELKTKSISQDKEFRNIVIIKFICPENIVPTNVNGYDSFWIRSRLAAGDYGSEKFIVTKTSDDQWTTEIDSDSIKSPFIEKILINFETFQNNKLPQYCLTNNNLICKNWIKNDQLTSFPIFKFLDEYSDNIFLGFDEKLSKGPFQIFFDIRKNTLFENFTGKSKFFYYDDRKKWKRIDVEDETNSFIKSGPVRFQFPFDFTKSNLFGDQLYWLKIENSKSVLNQIKGIFLNTVSAHNSQTKEEIIGSSNNLPEQEFKIQHSPIFQSDFKLWVNEYGFLSDDEEDSLIETHKLFEVKDENSKTIEQWVLWGEIPRLDSSNPFDRNFVINRVSRQVLFGDGTYGKIPPPGTENIKASYIFGGGKRGNLPKNSITELKTAVPFVEKVTNPLPSEGGLDTESIERATLRGPHSIKNRGRAITKGDYEWLVLENFPSIAKVRCLPASRHDGKTVGGNVTIVVVPTSSEQRPIPSHTLLENISTYLQKVNSNIIHQTNFFVISTIFVKISIKVDLHPKSIAVSHKAETIALSKLNKFLHPLFGGKEGNGWEFGELPCVSEIYELLEEIHEVDHVDNLTIQVTVEDEKNPYEFVIDDTASLHSIPNFSLIYGSQHEVRPLAMEVYQ